MKNQVIKPVATALWLLKNTNLTFNQIADFCGISPLEINSMADGFTESNLEPNDPIKLGQLTRSQISKCEENPKLSLEISNLPIFADITIKKSKKNYTPMAQRKNKVSAVLFLVQNYKFSVKQIEFLTGANKKIIQSIKDGTYPNIEEVTPKDPVALDLCTQVALNEEISKTRSTDDAK